MVNATIRAQELTEKVEAALARSEESERELRAAAEFREMFIGILSHDLRNPLGTIAMATEVLLAVRPSRRRMTGAASRGSSPAASA